MQEGDLHGARGGKEVPPRQERSWSSAGCSQLLQFAAAQVQPFPGAAAALPPHSSMQSKPWPCSASGKQQRGSACFLLKPLYPKPLTTSETLCAHLICVISLSGEIRSSFFHRFLFLFLLRRGSFETMP